ncbi:MAG: GrpB family protein [Bacteroidetes bacterium]|nr:GrpB family protein [Bacteroidota bacterium]
MKIIIEPYDKQWTEQFDLYKKAVQAALGVVAIEHIGSTSIEGLGAKPVIDILVGVKDVETLDGTINKMVAAGFTYMEVYKHLMVNRRYFVKYEHPLGHTPPSILANDRVGPAANGFVNKAHIHCWLLDSPDWERHIAFRDYLRQHENVRCDYQQLKEELAKQEWESSLAYSQAKNQFIKRVEADALAWYRAQTR